MNILKYLNPRNLIEYIDNKRDLLRVREGIMIEISYEYRRNPDTSLGRVIRGIWEDLDVALVGTSPEHKDCRVKVMRQALESLGLSK